MYNRPQHFLHFFNSKSNRSFFDMGLLLTLVLVRYNGDKVYDGVSLPRRSLFTLILKRFGLFIKMF